MSDVCSLATGNGGSLVDVVGVEGELRSRSPWTFDGCLENAREPSMAAGEVVKEDHGRSVASAAGR